MYVRTVWVGGFRHAILTHDDPYLLRLHAKRRRPNSCASCATTTNKSSRLSQHSDDAQERVRKLNFVLTSDKSRINQRPATSGDIEHLNLRGVDPDFDDELIIKASPQPLNETNRSNYNSLTLNMRNLRANKTTRTDAKENTDLSERVLQWLDLAGKIDLLAPDNVERMAQPRHSWPELQRRSNNLSKSKTAIDIHKEAGRTSPKGGDSPKAQQSGAIDRHEFYVPTSANTIENYARQSRNAKSTPRHETNAKIKDNHNKTKSRDIRTNVSEARLKVINEKNAVEKQYAEMLNKKLIPDVSKNPKRQVHIFMPELPKKIESTPASRTESLLSQTSYKTLKFDTTIKK